MSGILSRPIVWAIALACVLGLGLSPSYGQGGPTPTYGAPVYGGLVTAGPFANDWFYDYYDYPYGIYGYSSYPYSSYGYYPYDVYGLGWGGYVNPSPAYYSGPAYGTAALGTGIGGWLW